MAKTQNDQLKSPAKDQENRFLKNESLKPQVQQDQLGPNAQMAHAVNFPQHATADSIIQLQQRYGNNEVRRIIQRERTEDPVTDNQDNLSKNIAGEIQSARSGGQPLPPDVMDQMESKFGKDLSNVRLHPDQKADEISRNIQAKAFTVGNDIFFRKGAYSPNSEEGRNTLMHELTHVVQQSSGSASNGPLKLGDPNDKYEKEAEGFAKSGQQQSQEVSGSSPDTVQRLSVAGLKTKIGGVFSKGGKQSNPTPPQGTTAAPQPTATPAPAPKPGLNPTDLALVQQAGVLDQADWDKIPPEKQKLILGLVNSDSVLAKQLVAAFKASEWPKDDSGAEIIDAKKLDSIVNILKVSLTDWSSLDSPYKKMLIELKDKTYIQDLVSLAKTKNWPKDGNDQDISDENSFKTITEDLGKTLRDWVSITDKAQRGFLLGNGKQPYAKTLFDLALNGNWPKDGDDQFISDETIIKSINDTLKIPLDKWQTISDKNKRSFLLKNRAQPYAMKLGELALGGKWPKDGSDQDILNENHFILISVNWNIGLDKWLSIGEKEKRGFLLQNSTKPYAQQLLNLALNGKWPKNGNDQDIVDANSLDIMTKKWNITLDQWTSITDKDRRKFLLENGTKPYSVELAAVAHQNQWPQDDTGADLKDDTKLITMTKTLKIPINQWLNISDSQKRKCLLDNGTKPYAVELAGMALTVNWPKDGGDALIFEDGKLTTITNTLKISLASWLSITKERRGFLLDNSTNPYTPELVKLVLQSNWPKDGSDQEIFDDNKFKTITETLKISLTKWLSITEKDKRDFLLSNSTKSYIGDLVILAIQGNWPLDKSGSAILDDGILKNIKEKLNLSFSNWTKITSNDRRGNLLGFLGTLSDEQIKDLARAALSGVWPLDGGDRDITSAGEWKKILEAFPQMSPSYWNGLGAQIRNQALMQTSKLEIQKAINNAKFRRDKKENAMDKIGEVTGHGATDTVLSSVGLAGSITSLSKGTGDNDTLTRAGAATSATADAGNFLASSGSLLGGISQLRRGSKMSDKNSSQASKKFGEKEKTRGRWGITQSVFGMASSGSNFSGNVIKANDPSGESADKASSGLGVAGGIFGMIGSGLGLGKGSASMHSARKRSSAAKGFIKAAPATGALTNEDVKMNAIAQFTAKNQNKTGKGFGIFKSVTSFLGSGLGTAGGIGGLTNMSKDAGFGLGIAGAALSGLGILGGIGQMIAEKKNKPNDSELNTQATNLIDLLKSNNPEAIRFVKDVLKIKDFDVNWISEDEAAATALIKSKLSKL